MKKGHLLHAGILSGLSFHRSVPLFYVYRPKQDEMTMYEYFNTIKKTLVYFFKPGINISQGKILNIKCLEFFEVIIATVYTCLFLFAKNNCICFSSGHSL